MSAPSEAGGAPVAGKADLIEWFEAGCKPADQWRAGTEHEKFCYHLEDNRPLAYDGEVGIRRMLELLASEFDWEPVLEGNNVIALTSGTGGSITLEPGGQFELSGAPLQTVHQTCAEVHRHLDELKEINQTLGVGMIGTGFQPKWSFEDTPQMPKGRYKVMRAYMPKKGKLGLDMMHRTCTVQTNLDYGSEADMVRKFRVSLALQPIATALWANSPFVNGKPSGYLSYRSHCWTDTDPDRCGMLPFVFEDGFGFERYVDYLLDVPMYFVYRDGQYVDCSGLSFRDFMKGELSALPGQTPHMGDWVDHVSTVFPEVRLKRFLEMRGADGGPWRRLCALPAFWIGLLYDGEILDGAWDLVKGWSVTEQEDLRTQVPKLGLRAEIHGRTVRDIALELLSMARTGLAKRGFKNQWGDDEGIYLTPLQTIANRGTTPAEEKLEAFNTRWNGDIDRIFRDYAY